MAFLFMVFRKMLKNKWLIFCLLLGLITSIALISCIPVYTQAVLQKYLIRELEKAQKEDEKYTGAYVISAYIQDDKLKDTVKELEEKDENILKNKTVLDFYNKRLESFNRLEAYISKNAEKSIGITVLASYRNYSIDKREIIPEKESKPEHEYAEISSVSGIENHIRLIDGKMPSKAPVDGIYEAMVPENALPKLNIVIGQVYTLKDVRKKWGIAPIKIKPVGVFTVKDSNDPFWTYLTPGSFSESFIIDEELLVKDFIKSEPTIFYYARWYFAVDYHAVTIGKLPKITNGNAKILKDTNEIWHDGKIYADTPIMKVMETYYEKSEQLTRMMWALNIPIIIMLFLFLFMISRLIIEREKNEISLFASRGATRLQIVAGYAFESLILGSIAFVTGLFFSVALTKLLGSSNGFLEFANRKALPIEINRDAFIYAALGLVASLLTILIPAFTASRISIVNYKQKLVRKEGFALWEKIFLDIILIAISAYGYYSFTQRQTFMKATAANFSDVQIDPILFVVPALFILGTGLICLRIYPLLIKLIYHLGSRWWNPPIYVTLTQIGRSLKGYHFMMIFMIMTLSIGIFSATAARTINLNEKEKIQYGTGSDMVLEQMWENDTPNGMSGGMQGPQPQNRNSNEEIKVKRTQYFEPSFLKVATLPGVENAAKVFTKKNVYVEVSAGGKEGPTLMGIDPYEFGKVAWFRNGLLDHHINQYLNILTSEPSACFISRSASEAGNVKVNDTIQVSWPTSGKATYTVYGIIDYWPSWNPNKAPDDKEENVPMLIVANLKYIQEHNGLEPYKVWLKLKPGTTSKEVYDGIKQSKLAIVDLEDSYQEVVALKNDPFQLAINGALTLGFIISGFVCFCGFLIYWILSIKSRTLQFGIFRAMGLKLRHLVSIMVCEQVLTSGTAIAIGIVIGLLSSRLFVPFFQLAFDSASQVPPFRVVSFSGDRLKIYILVGITMTLGFLTLGFLLSRIKINQAIKLGEE